MGRGLGLFGKGERRGDIFRIKFVAGNVHGLLCTESFSLMVGWFTRRLFCTLGNDEMGELKIGVGNIRRFAWGSCCRIRVGCFAAALNKDRKFCFFDVGDDGFRVIADKAIRARRFLKYFQFFNLFFAFLHRFSSCFEWSKKTKSPSLNHYLKRTFLSKSFLNAALANLDRSSGGSKHVMKSVMYSYSKFASCMWMEHVRCVLRQNLFDYSARWVSC